MESNLSGAVTPCPCKFFTSNDDSCVMYARCAGLPRSYYLCWALKCGQTGVPALASLRPNA